MTMLLEHQQSKRSKFVDVRNDLTKAFEKDICISFKILQNELNSVRQGFGARTIWHGSDYKFKKAPTPEIIKEPASASPYY